MADIFLEKIGTNRYAPEGANDISLFAYNGAEGLTIGQLVNAICIRRGVHQERQSTLVMNRLSVATDKLTTVANLTERILAANGAWNTDDKNYIINDLKVEAKDLPDALDTYQKRMRVFDILRQKLTELNGSVDRLAIQLQTAVSRRDAAYSIATMTVSHLGKSMSQTAGYF